MLRSILKIPIVLVTLSMLLPGSAPPAAAQAAPRPRYFVIDLSRAGDQKSAATCLNASGQVAGYYTAPNGKTLAFLWDPRQPFATARETLDPFLVGLDNSEALGINDAGVVVGGATQAGGANQRAFVKVPGQVMALFPLGPGTSRATGINNNGFVVGSAAPFGPPHAYFTAPGQAPLDLGTLGGAVGNSDALGINALGHVVGISRVPAAIGFYHAFRWNIADGMEDLGVFAGSGSRFSLGRAINVGDQVVGHSQIGAAVNSDFHAFLKQPGQAMQDLGTLPGTSVSTAFGINNVTINGRGQVVGASWNVGGDGRPVNQRAFLWEDNKGMQDLNDLIPQGSGWVLQEARGINDREEIVGQGTRFGQTRAFLLIPIPGPGVRIVPEMLRHVGSIGFRLQASNASLDVAADIAPSDDPDATADAIQGAVNSLGLPDWRAVRDDTESADTAIPYLWFEHLNPMTNLWDIVAEIDDWRDTTGGTTSFQVWDVRGETDPAAGAVFSFGIGGDAAAGGADATAFNVLPGHASASVRIPAGALPDDLATGLEAELGQSDLVVQPTSPTSFTITVLPGAVNPDPELQFGVTDDALWVQGAGIQVVPAVNGAALTSQPMTTGRGMLR